jgi:DNA-binding MarR family transcriptional regulator
MELRRNRHGDVPLPGELNGNHILTDKEVLAIRELYLAGGVTQVSIADAFGVSKGTINHVVKGRSWKHLL